MELNLDTRRVRMSVGELADFTLGPKESGESASGIWRAQLGTRWHQSLRAETAQRDPAAEFERVVQGDVAERGWVISLNGRIDQLVADAGGKLLREIKTVTCALPADESELRADYPGYFIQLAAYACLLGQESGESMPRPKGAELLFVEPATGVTQTVALTRSDEYAFLARLSQVAEFAELQLRARERRLRLRFLPPFSQPRPGQDGIAEGLRAALETDSKQTGAGQTPAILFEAPTGFGKTGALLELALGQLRSGRFDRVIYLTGKATGQLQVARTLEAMTGAPAGAATGGESTPVSSWIVRNKAEHCVNSVYHCVRDACALISGSAQRWPGSGLARFYLFENQAHDVETLRIAGRAARICPYEITRTSLAFQDVWVGDYNYVFSPSSRGIFYEQPGFQPSRTLLLIDEAHNLPSRVAGVYSHVFEAEDAFSLRSSLDSANAPPPMIQCVGEWARFLEDLDASPKLSPGTEDDARDLIRRLADAVSVHPLDYAAIGPSQAARLWGFPQIAHQLEQTPLPLLWWCSRRGQLALTCLDAAEAIGATVRGFGGVVFATATPGPWDAFAAASGAPVTGVRAHTPWRAGAYDVAYDVRVDTSFRQRARYASVTAATVSALCAHSPTAVAVFFPSYAYAETVSRELAGAFGSPTTALQPRQSSLSVQSAWVEASLSGSDALFLVLGSGFAESIDMLGGRVTHAMVVGPALPEVNPVQRARIQALAGEGREGAFERVYRIPGLQKVNQALGRLVRAPGQRAKVLLHCRRFADPEYAKLLADDYRDGRRIETDADLDEWLARREPLP